MMFKKIITWIKARLDYVNLIGRSVDVGESCYIKGSNISGNVFIGNKCRIYKSEISGNITIGNNTSIWGPNTDIYAKINAVNIGNFCSIARNVSIQEYNHSLNKITTYYMGQNVFGQKWGNEQSSKGPIEIGNDVWIGAQCLILSGAQIGNGAVIAANSVVTGVIPDFAIAGGTPAKVLKYRFSPEIIEELQALQWWDWSSEKIIENKHIFEEELTLALLRSIK